MCHSLLHKLYHEQLKTTKELLDIATRHTSGEEVVGATFVLGNTKATTSASRAAPSKATVKGTRGRVPRVARRGRSDATGMSLLQAMMTATMRKLATPMRSMSQPPNMISSARCGS
jgi:hypothetical protein